MLPTGRPRPTHARPSAARRQGTSRDPARGSASGSSLFYNTPALKRAPMLLDNFTVASPDVDYTPEHIVSRYTCVLREHRARHRPRRAGGTGGAGAGGGAAARAPAQACSEALLRGAWRRARAARPLGVSADRRAPRGHGGAGTRPPASRRRTAARGRCLLPPPSMSSAPSAPSRSLGAPPSPRDPPHLSRPLARREGEQRGLGRRCARGSPPRAGRCGSRARGARLPGEGSCLWGGVGTTARR